MAAIQDLIPGNHCFGCGPDNPHGMQIKSYWDGKESTCEYMPRPEQCAGPTQYLYGGTIASIIDCHCVCTAIANYYESDGHAIGEGPPIWCVTGRLTVNYLKPTLLDQPVTLRAQIRECGEKKTILACTVYSEGVATAEGEVIAIRRMAELQSTLEKSRAALETERGEREFERKQLQDASEVSTRVIFDLEKAVAAASDRASSFEARCTALNEKIEENSKTIQSLQTNLDTSKTETKSLKREIASLKSDLMAAQSDAAEAHGRTLDLKKEREAGEGELTAVKEQLSEAISELEQLRGRLRVKEENQEANHEIQALREALETAQAEYRALMKNTEESHSSLAGVSAKLLHSRSIEAALKAKAAEDARSLKKLRTDLENTKAALAQARGSGMETSNKSGLSSDEVPPSASGFHEMRTAKADRAEKLLEQAQRDAATYAGEAHDLRSRIRADEAALTAANEKNKQIEAELKQLRKEMAELGTRSSTVPATSNGEPALDADETVPKLKAQLAASQEVIKQIDRTLYAVTTERDCFETMLKGLKVNFAQMSDRLAGFEAWAEANGVWDEACNALPAPLPAEETHF